jgi:hypothetical protein
MIDLHRCVCMLAYSPRDTHSSVLVDRERSVGATRTFYRIPRVFGQFLAGSPMYFNDPRHSFERLLSRVVLMSWTGRGLQSVQLL